MAPIEPERDLLARARASARRLLAELRRDRPAIADDQARALFVQLETTLQRLDEQLEKGTT